MHPYSGEIAMKPQEKHLLILILCMGMISCSRNEDGLGGPCEPGEVGLC